MLRTIFQLPKRGDDGLIKAVNEEIAQFCSRVRSKRALPDRFYKLELYTAGFTRAMDELEQSKFCAEQYGAHIKKLYEGRMTDQERDQYHLFLYYYKNAFIRVFSVLDKLGYFLNEMYELKTERIKPHFSYYTVLRQMHKRDAHAHLEQQLYETKMKHKDAMSRLRHKRNTEIHYINVEILNDVPSVEEQFREELKVENVTSLLDDLEQGYTMVAVSMIFIFQQAGRDLRKQ